MEEKEQDNRSPQHHKPFHPFFKPSMGLKRDHANGPASNSNNNDQPKIKVKKSTTLWLPPKSSSNSPAIEPDTTSTTSVTATAASETSDDITDDNKPLPLPLTTESPSAPLHPFFTKRSSPASGSNQQPVKSKREGSTSTSSNSSSSSSNRTNNRSSPPKKTIARKKESQSIAPSPTTAKPVPHPPPIVKHRNKKDYRNGPVWPDKTLFEGGHIGVPSRPTASLTLSNADRSSGSSSSGSNNTIPSTSTVFLHQEPDRTYINDIIRNKSSQYFTSLPNRPASTRPKKQHATSKRYTMSSTEIRQLVESIYPSCKKSLACQALLDNLSRKDKTQHHYHHRRHYQQKQKRCTTDNIPWTELYRPSKVQELLGNQEDNLYLRDWLYQMKVAAPSTLDAMAKKASSSSSSSTTTTKRKNKGKSKRLLDAFFQDPVAYANMIEEQEEDDDFIPSGRRGRPASKKKKEQDMMAMQSNLILLVGDHGSGKTAAVYTAAEEAGYQVFEIHPGMKRSGKDLFSYVGEMTESHLVTSHPTTSSSSSTSSESKINKKRKLDHKDNTSNESQFMRQFAATTIADESSSDVIDIEGDGDHDLMEVDQEQQQDEEAKQSLVLLEEVDVLYEDDKGFWSSVVELAQKSKRPIVLTCNDRNSIPMDMLFLQGILDYRYPDIEELMAYLHLICFSEGYLVHPVDLAGLVAATKNDLRQLINTLELLCTEKRVDQFTSDNDAYAENADSLLSLFKCSDLFDRYTTVTSASTDTTTNDTTNLDKNCEDEEEILIRIQQPHSNSGIDLVRFHEKCIVNNDVYRRHFINENRSTNNINIDADDYDENSLSNIVNQLEQAFWEDLLASASIRQNHQLHECDEYGPSQDQLLGYTTTWKHPTDLDHWRLNEDIKSYYWAKAYKHIKDDEWRKALLPTVWEELIKERTIAMNEYMYAAQDLIPLRAYYLSDTLTMAEYIPYIRGMCQDDQGVASRGRSLRTRRKRRYLPLTEEQRLVLLEDPIYRDTTDDWCERTLEWSKRFTIQ